jgi:hypothetical protein
MCIAVAAVVPLLTLASEARVDGGNDADDDDEEKEDEEEEACDAVGGGRLADGKTVICAEDRKAYVDADANDDDADDALED